MSFPFLFFLLLAFGEPQFFNFQDADIWKRPKRNLMTDYIKSRRDAVDEQRSWKRPKKNLMTDYIKSRQDAVDEQQDVIDDYFRKYLIDWNRSDFD